MKDLFVQLLKIDNEAKNIVQEAANEANTSIHKLKDEAGSEIAAIKKTSDIIEVQRTAENLSKINALRMETEKYKVEKMDQLAKIVQKNWTKAIEAGIALLEKIN